MKTTNKKLKGLKAARNRIKDMGGLYYQIVLNVKTGEVTWQRLGNVHWKRGSAIKGLKK